jgi:hypothetical protein
MLKHCLIAIELFANANRVTVLGIGGAKESVSQLQMLPSAAEAAIHMRRLGHDGGDVAGGLCWGGFGVLI